MTDIDALRAVTGQLLNDDASDEGAWLVMARAHIRDLQAALDAKFPPLTDEIVLRAVEAEYAYVTSAGYRRVKGCNRDWMRAALEAVWPK